MQTLQKQRGWMGILALLFAVAIVALMARSALREYGLYPGSSARVEGTERVDPYKGIRVAPAGVDPTAATPVPDDPMARVRQIGNTVRDRAAVEVDRANR